MLKRCGTCSVSGGRTLKLGEADGTAAAAAGADSVRARSAAWRVDVRPDASGAGRAVLIRVGSRGSRLALTQAELAAAHLRAPGIEIALVPITTAGDRDRTKPFGEIGSRGVFVKELEEALLEQPHRRRGALGEGHDVDRSRRPRRRRVPRARRSARRALRRGRASRRACASARRRSRRKAQLLALEPTLSIEPLRGNIDTRLRKRGERGLDAIVLAACGLDRLGLGAEIGRRFDPERAAARGRRRARSRCRCARARSSSSRPPTTRRRGAASRPSARCIAAVGGGCLAPVAAHHDGTTLTALIAAEDGSWLERRSGDDPAALGRELASLER